MKNWRKGIASWQIKRTLYLSVVFTWDLPKAKRMADNHNGPVIAGGPAAMLMPDYLGCQVEPTSPFNPLAFHNPLATFTTRGCPNHCSFCAVPVIEGDFQELNDWQPLPIVCDNNLLAASKKHFDRVIDKLKTMPYVDFNQGLDARLFTPHHARRLAELNEVKVRFAFDHTNQETILADAIGLAKNHGLRDFGVYVLIGHDDTPDDAIYRLEFVKGLGILPNPMRFQPLYALEKNQYVHPNWTDKELKKVMRYYWKLVYTKAIPFDEFDEEPTLNLW